MVYNFKLKKKIVRQIIKQSWITLFRVIDHHELFTATTYNLLPLPPSSPLLSHIINTLRLRYNSSTCFISRDIYVGHARKPAQS